ncbi:unnamed protein product [marine sediment metagenome]|uniref:Uncharacterized protein n=1 Tax=marine sediment metagenome TaxID=412755 RepID=X1AVY8_9ZZZZ
MLVDIIKLKDILWNLGNDFIRIDRKRIGMLLADYGEKREELINQAITDITDLKADYEAENNELEGL